jgi:outer membrane protein TolC
MRRTIVLLGALALAPSLLAAQGDVPPPGTPVRLTLQEAVRRALEGEEVRLARSNVELARGQVVAARSDALPQIRTQLSYQRTFASPFQSGPSGPPISPFAPDTTAAIDQRVRYLENQYDSTLIRGIGSLFGSLPLGRENTWSGGVTISQLLFQGGKVGAGLAGAHAYRDAATAQLDETRQDIVFRTRKAYLDALYTERVVVIAEDGRRLAEEQLHRVELNQRVGSAAEYDLLRARVEVSNQDPAVVSARNSRDLAYTALRWLVNVPSGTPMELDAGALTMADSLVEVDTVQLQQAVASRRLLDAAEANVDLRRHAVRFYRGDYWPQLRANLYMGAQAYPSGFTPVGQQWRHDWYASFTISWPLFEGLRTRGQIQQAQAQLEQARAQLAQTEEQVELEVEQARAELFRARALLDARRVTVTQASQAHRLAGVRYANGISTQLEVSDARLAMQQSELNEAAATRDYLVAIANMERALGRPVPMRMVERRASAEPASAATETRE